MRLTQKCGNRGVNEEETLRSLIVKSTFFIFSPFIVGKAEVFCKVSVCGLDGEGKR